MMAGAARELPCNVPALWQCEPGPYTETSDAKGGCMTREEVRLTALAACAG